MIKLLMPVNGFNTARPILMGRNTLLCVCRPFHRILYIGMMGNVRGRAR